MNFEDPNFPEGYPDIDIGVDEVEVANSATEQQWADGNVSEGFDFTTSEPEEDEDEDEE